MSFKQFEYTTLAHRYTARYPLLTYVGIQVNFWIIANCLLVVILYFGGMIIAEMSAISSLRIFRTPAFILAILVGLIYGTGQGLTGYYLDKRYFRKLPLGKIIVFKSFFSVILFAFILFILRTLFFDNYSVREILGIRFNEKSWNQLIYMLLIFYFFMSLLISFINQINKKYGPGVLIPLLLGRYRTPKEEKRIFMDLMSSTSVAEKLGHLKYSSFIRDCFTDINEVLYEYQAQVYQYVGDEIVVMWPEREGLRDQNCIQFYFAVNRRFNDRSAYYHSHYGVLPVFKAGLHAGNVTAVEIGEIKQDIAYHGDTINTAARIQGVCNDYGQYFLASEYIVGKVGSHPSFSVQKLGKISLKGKSEKVAVVSITSN